MYVRKYNTFYYIKRNNHFICELVSLILFLKSTNIRFKNRLKIKYINQVNKEIKNTG